MMQMINEYGHGFVWRKFGATFCRHALVRPGETALVFVEPGARDVAPAVGFGNVAEQFSRFNLNRYRLQQRVNDASCILINRQQRPSWDATAKTAFIHRIFETRNTKSRSYSRIYGNQ